MQELKPCPFCGCEAEPYPDGDMEGHSVMCSGKAALFGGKVDDCPMRTFGYESHDAATEAWNRRAPNALSVSGQVPLQRLQLRAQGDGLFTASEVEDKLADQRAQLGIGGHVIGAAEHNVQDGKAEFNVHPEMVAGLVRRHPAPDAARPMVPSPCERFTLSADGRPRPVDESGVVGVGDLRQEFEAWTKRQPGDEMPLDGAQWGVSFLYAHPSTQAAWIGYQGHASGVKGTTE